MLDEAIANLNLLIDGEISRRPIPDIDWTQVTLEGDRLTFNGRPVFLADYTWKPRIPELTEFYGDLESPYMDPNRVKMLKEKLLPGL
jgi:hypothetical protein